MKTKHFVYAALLLCGACLTACDDDNQEKIDVTIPNLDMPVHDTYEIKSRHSNWQSADPDIASVSGNILTANHVGETTVTGPTHTFAVVVRAKYFNYEAPCTEWGATADEVKAFMEGFTLVSADNDRLVYEGQEKAESYVYTFDAGKLTSAQVTSLDIYAISLSRYLNERYVYEEALSSYDNEDFYFTSLDKRTSIHAYKSASDVWSVVYTPAN